MKLLEKIGVFLYFAWRQLNHQPTYFLSKSKLRGWRGFFFLFVSPAGGSESAGPYNIAIPTMRGNSNTYSN